MDGFLLFDTSKIHLWDKDLNAHIEKNKNILRSFSIQPSIRLDETTKNDILVKIIQHFGTSFFELSDPATIPLHDIHFGDHDTGNTELELSNNNIDLNARETIDLYMFIPFEDQISVIDIQELKKSFILHKSINSYFLQDNMYTKENTICWLFMDSENVLGKMDIYSLQRYDDLGIKKFLKFEDLDHNLIIQKEPVYILLERLMLEIQNYQPKQIIAQKTINQKSKSTKIIDNKRKIRGILSHSDHLDKTIKKQKLSQHSSNTTTPLHEELFYLETKEEKDLLIHILQEYLDTYKHMFNAKIYSDPTFEHPKSLFFNQDSIELSIKHIKDNEKHLYSIIKNRILFYSVLLEYKKYCRIPIWLLYRIYGEYPSWEIFIEPKIVKYLKKNDLKENTNDFYIALDKLKAAEYELGIFSFLHRYCFENYLIDEHLRIIEEKSVFILMEIAAMDSDFEQHFLFCEKYINDFRFTYLYMYSESSIDYCIDNRFHTISLEYVKNNKDLFFFFQRQKSIKPYIKSLKMSLKLTQNMKPHKKEEKITSFLKNTIYSYDKTLCTKYYMIDIDNAILYTKKIHTDIIIYKGIAYLHHSQIPCYMSYLWLENTKKKIVEYRMKKSYYHGPIWLLQELDTSSIQSIMMYIKHFYKIRNNQHSRNEIELSDDQLDIILKSSTKTLKNIQKHEYWDYLRIIYENFLLYIQTSTYTVENLLIQRKRSYVANFQGDSIIEDHTIDELDILETPGQLVERDPYSGFKKYYSDMFIDSQCWKIGIHPSDPFMIIVFARYNLFVPPCISKIIFTAIDDGIHPNNTSRLILSRYLYSFRYTPEQVIMFFVELYKHDEKYKSITFETFDKMTRGDGSSIKGMKHTFETKGTVACGGIIANSQGLCPFSDKSLIYYHKKNMISPSKTKLQISSKRVIDIEDVMEDFAKFSCSEKVVSNSKTQKKFVKDDIECQVQSSKDLEHNRIIGQKLCKGLCKKSICGSSEQIFYTSENDIDKPYISGIRRPLHYTELFIKQWYKKSLRLTEEEKKQINN